MPDPVALPAAAAPAAAAPAAAPAAAAAPWHGSTDAETVAYVAAKGWADPAGVIKSYQNAEKLIGRDPSSLLVIPKEGDDVAQRALYARLGMPETADKYDMRAGLAKEAAIDDAFSKPMQDLFHKAGLSAKQAALITEGYNKFGVERSAQAVKDYELSVQNDKRILLGEWRGSYERKVNAAQTAAAALGFTAEEIDHLETKLGYAATMRRFADIGERLGESKFVTGEVKIPGMLSPAEAREEIRKIDLDPSQKAALIDAQHPQHKATKEKRSKLFTIAYPEER